MPIEPHDDGLILPEVGSWSKRKFHFLGRYLNAFSVAMRNKGWNGLHYIDLFAGAGFCRIKDTDTVLAGSPILAANTSPAFDQLHLAEKNARKFEALKQRLSGTDFTHESQLLNADANDAVGNIVKSIPNGSLSVAFIDPYGLHFAFESIQSLSNARTDLVILFPDHMDVIRNWRTYYDSNPESNLDQFLPAGSEWRPLIDAPNPLQAAADLRKMYLSGLERIGYR